MLATVYRPGHDDPVLISTADAPKTQALNPRNFDFSHLSFPKKPAWRESMTAEEIDKNERTAFLEWRRQLALLESAHNFTLKLTPFEKNLDVWRQLWRVCERSDILLQVVDARNPLLYLTRELLEHVGHSGRHMVVVLNKADLLTPLQREAWARYHIYTYVRCDVIFPDVVTPHNPLYRYLYGERLPYLHVAALYRRGPNCPTLHHASVVPHPSRANVLGL
ncbi:hypothetical protein EON64_10170, partial [archaeon]